MKCIISKLQNFTVRAKYPCRVNRPHSSSRCIVCERRGAESKASVASKHIINAVLQVFVMVAWCEHRRDLHSKWCFHASRRLQKCSSCSVQKLRTGRGKKNIQAATPVWVKCLESIKNIHNTMKTARIRPMCYVTINGAPLAPLLDWLHKTLMTSPSHPLFILEIRVLTTLIACS